MDSLKPSAVYNPGVDYCGPARVGWLTKVIPRRLFGVDINRCCFDHDQAYMAGGTGMDRLIADRALQVAIEGAFARAKWVPRWLGRFIARRYYVAVRVWGAGCFAYTT